MTHYFTSATVASCHRVISKSESMTGAQKARKETKERGGKKTAPPFAAGPAWAGCALQERGKGRETVDGSDKKNQKTTTTKTNKNKQKKTTATL